MADDLYFGMNLQSRMQAWFSASFYFEVLRRKYGDGCMIAGAILDSTLQHDWQDPLANMAVCLQHGTEERIGGPEGLLANVQGKLHFCLRTRLNSSEARLRPDLLEPGDFPYEGAGFYRGYAGGVSGLSEEQDWWVFCRMVDEYIEFRASAAERFVVASKARKPGMKYLAGTLDEDSRWDLAKQT